MMEHNPGRVDVAAAELRRPLLRGARIFQRSETVNEAAIGHRDSCAQHGEGHSGSPFESPCSAERRWLRGEDGEERPLSPGVVDDGQLGGNGASASPRVARRTLSFDERKSPRPLQRQCSKSWKPLTWLASRISTLGAELESRATHLLVDNDTMMPSVLNDQPLDTVSEEGWSSDEDAIAECLEDLEHQHMRGESHSGNRPWLSVPRARSSGATGAGARAPRGAFIRGYKSSPGEGRADSGSGEADAQPSAGADVHVEAEGVEAGAMSSDWMHRQRQAQDQDQQVGAAGPPWAGEVSGSGHSLRSARTTHQGHAGRPSMAASRRSSHVGSRIRSVPLEHRPKLWMACQHICNALESYDQGVCRCTTLAFNTYLLLPWVDLVLRMIRLALVLLTFLEVPRWCLAWKTPEMPCKNALWPTWHNWYLEKHEALSLETLGALLLLLGLAMRLTAFGASHFRDRRRLLAAVSLLLYCADIAYAFHAPHTWIRLGPLLRGVLIALASKDLVQHLQLLAYITPRFLKLGGYIAMFVLSFAFAGTLLFQDVPEEKLYFGNFWSSMWSLMVLLCTKNYPDVVLGAYQRSHLYEVFFGVYMLLGIFFLMKLVSAVVFSAFLHEEERLNRAAAQRVRECLDEAYDLLDWEGCCIIRPPRLLALIECLRRMGHMVGRQPALRTASGALLLFFMDYDHSGTISRKEFYQLPTLLKVRFERVHQPTFMEKWFPRVANSQRFRWLQALVLSKAFEWLVDGLVVALAAATVVEFWPALGLLRSGRQPAREPTLHTFSAQESCVVVPLEIACALLWTLEGLLCCAALGWRMYWAKHKLVLGLGVVSASSTLALLLPRPLPPWLMWLDGFAVLSWSGLGAVARMLRAMVGLCGVRVYYRAVLHMIAPAARFIKLLLFVLYCFACVGVLLFGGLVNMDPNNKQFAVLERMQYGLWGYWEVNLNDMPGAMEMLFMLLVGNKCVPLVDALCTVSTLPGARIFFDLFFVVGNLICLNVVVAFIISTFLKNSQAETPVVVGQGAINGDQALFDADGVSGAVPGLEGQYVATLCSDQDAKGKAEELQTMFRRVTQTEDIARALVNTKQATNKRRTTSPELLGLGGNRSP